MARKAGGGSKVMKKHLAEIWMVFGVNYPRLKS